MRGVRRRRTPLLRRRGGLIAVQSRHQVHFGVGRQ
jgi:hypothetical protein